MDAKTPHISVPPRAAQHPTTHQVHGVEISDPYAWLRADNWQEVMRDAAVLAPDIREYLEAENAYREKVMADTAKLQDELYKEMRGRIKEDDSSVPSPDGAYAYYVRFRDGGQYPLYCRTAREGGPEELLLDGDAMGDGKAYFSLAAASQSPDHRLLAYGVDETGSEFYTLKVRDLSTGRDLPDIITETSSGGVWSADGRYIFYVRLDPNHRPRWVYCHELGTASDTDRLVYEEQDPSYFLGIGKTQDEQFILISAHEHQTSEVRLIPAARPLDAPRLLIARETGHEYHVEHHSGRLFIHTNRQAEDFRIVEAPFDNPSPDNWRDVVAHQAGRLILNMEVLKNHLVWLERLDGLPRIVVRRLSDGEEHVIAFDEEAYALGLQVGYEFDTASIRINYSSMTTPARVYDYDMETRERVLRKEQEVPSGHDPADYVTKRLMAPSHDGELVPISLLYHKETKLDGSAPLLLYGYGAYGITIPAGFSGNRLSLVDRGFVFALAHIRGGKDRGYRWYRTGRGPDKANTFKDFIAAGDYLVEQNYTSKGRIIAEGRSAGGMLMGAVANMAPDLFLGIIAGVPFVDVLNTMLDDTLPLTPPEWGEWGNPLADRQAFDLIHSYSPYDNVRAQAYPHILATGGLADPRVTYWEPAKWVARLRELKTDDNLLLMKMEMTAGHGGRSGRFEALRELAHDYAFALKVAGTA